jgi:hypothetical protein
MESLLQFLMEFGNASLLEQALVLIADHYATMGWHLRCDIRYLVDRDVPRSAYMMHLLIRRGYRIDWKPAFCSPKLYFTPLLVNWSLNYYQSSRLLEQACCVGNALAVRLFLARLPVTRDNRLQYQELLRVAINDGHQAVVCAFLPLFNERKWYVCLSTLARAGMWSAIQMRQPYLEVNDFDLVCACRDRNTNLLRFLLSHYQFTHKCILDRLKYCVDYPSSQFDLLTAYQAQRGYIRRSKRKRKREQSANENTLRPDFDGVQFVSYQDHTGDPDDVRQPTKKKTRM